MPQSYERYPGITEVFPTPSRPHSGIHNKRINHGITKYAITQNFVGHLPTLNG